MVVEVKPDYPNLVFNAYNRYWQPAAVMTIAKMVR